MWALGRRVSETGHPELPLLSVYRDHGVVPREGRDDNYNRPGEDLGSYQRVLPGDLVLNKMKTWQGSLGVSQHEGIVSPAYFVFRLNASACLPRYMHHLLRSQPYIRLYGAASKGIRPQQWDLPWDAFRTIAVDLPDPEEQRRIADFLDANVVRLDQAMALRRRQAEVVHEAATAVLTNHYTRAVEKFGAARLGLLLSGLEQGWSPQCEDRLATAAEYGVLKAGAVNGGLFRPTEHKALPSSLSPRLEYLVRPGDLLMSRASGSLDLIGSAAVVPPDTPTNLLLCDKVYRLSFDRRVDPTFIAQMLRSRPVREAIKLGTSGAEGMANNLPSGTVRGLLMPAAPLEHQRTVAAEIVSLDNELRSARILLDRSSALFEERRQALITTAATGQFDVTTARAVA